MKILGGLKEIIAAHLYSVIPQRYKEEFSETVYYYNLSRLSLQAAALFIVDILSLGLYLFEYLRGIRPFLPYHIAVHGCKILCNALWFVYFRKAAGSRNYRQGSFFSANMAVIYQGHFAVSEFLLFITGPQDLGALCRFFVSSLIMGAVAVMKQTTAFFLELGVYLLYVWGLVFRSAYSFNFTPGELIFHAFGVSCFCANLIADTIYSSHVNNFVHRARAQEAQEALQSTNEQLERLSRLDPLTGLGNRRDLDLFLDLTWRIREGAAGASGGGSGGASGGGAGGNTAVVVKLDLDYFKAYNDRFGHVAGDKVLMDVGTTLAETFSLDELAARTGADDFILVSYSKEYGEMLRRVEEFRQKVENLRIENPDSDISPYLTVSAGLASVCLDRHWDRDQIFQWADECLYFAKQNGRNRVVATRDERRRFTDARGQMIHRDYSQGRPQTPSSGVPSGPGGPAGPDRPAQIYDSLRRVSGDYTFIYDRGRNLMEFSDMAQEVYGLPGQIENPSLVTLISTLILKSDRRPFIQTLRWSLRNKQKNISTTIQLLQGEGSSVWVTLRIHCVYGSRGEISFVSGNFVDMNTVIQYTNYIRQREALNPITSLPNRQKFYEDIQRQLIEEGNYGYLVFIDISNFNLINRMYSHNLGDKVLKIVAGLLKKLTYKTGTIYNYAVDQFLVIARKMLPGDIELMVQEILHYFKQKHVEIDNIDLRIAFSMGAARYEAGSTVIEDLLVDLELTVQKVKLEEQQRFAFFSLSDKIEYLSKVNLEKEIHDSIEDNFRGFTLYYQPIVTVPDFRCVGAEALLRWESPDGVLVSPAYVIPILEKTGRIVAVETWLFEEVCRQLAEWKKGGIGEDFFIHINLSSSYISRNSLFDEIREPLDKYGLAPDNILLEVTESSLILEMQKSVDALSHLRQRQFRIAVDDFGTGYSSLSYLKNLPVDEIKIDRSFVTNMEEDAGVRGLFTAVVEMIKNMGYLVCVEGIETQGQVDIATSLDVDYLQGYFFAKPVAAGQFREQVVESLQGHTT